jgi:hypothetical protein
LFECKWKSLPATLRKLLEVAVKWEKNIAGELACLLATWDGETKSPVRKGKNHLARPGA